MASRSMIRRKDLVLLLLVAAVVALGWAAPATAGGLSYAEAPMQVMKEGLTAEQHLRQQAHLSLRLSREMPAGAFENALRAPVAAEEIAAIDRGSRSVSPLPIGLVKAMSPGIAVAGLDRRSLAGQPLQAGQVSRTPDGGFVWAAVVRAEEAGAIRLHIEGLSLPRNAALYVYSRSGEAYGPYTATGPNRTGELWTTALFGPEAILQLRLAAPVRQADLRKVSFRVTEAGLITRGFAGDLVGIFQTRHDTPTKVLAGWPCGNQSCILDATCATTAAAAAPEKLAAAKMEWVAGAFIYTCTGALLSETNPTQDNFFLTANHCLSKNSNAQSVSFYWKFATSACNGTCPENAAWPYKTTGSTVSATNRRGDFTLLHLNSNPPAGSVYLGWTSAPVANTNGAALYRISNPGFGPQVYSAHAVDTAVGTCTGWPRGERIYSRDITGAIDGGSSGSPVMNASSQVVGQLSGTCGFASSEVCSSGPGESNATVDGALAYYFATVKPFINP